MLGYDYTSRIAPAALLAPDADGERCAVVFRYTTRPDWPKSITRAEVDELGRIRMPLACNFESTADRMRGAASAGEADATEQAKNLTALGIRPQAVRSWFSADWDVQPDQVTAVLDYLHAAADVLGGKRFVGCYGGLRAVAAAADAGFAIWQTIAWSFRNGTVQWDPRAAARQTGKQLVVGGVEVDVNDIRNLDALGAWTGGEMELTDTVAVTPGFAQRYPATAGDGFTAGAQIPVGTLLLGAAIRDANNEHVLAQVLAGQAQLLAAVKQQAMPVDALASAIVAKLPASIVLDPATIAAVAAAVETMAEQHNLGGLSAAQMGAALTAAATTLNAGGA